LRRCESTRQRGATKLTRTAPPARRRPGRDAGGLEFSRLDEFATAYLKAVDEDLEWYLFWR
jgi:hypothetical protein